MSIKPPCLEALHQHMYTASGSADFDQSSSQIPTKDLTSQRLQWLQCPAKRQARLALPETVHFTYGSDVPVNQSLWRSECSQNQLDKRRGVLKLRPSLSIAKPLRRQNGDLHCVNLAVASDRELHCFNVVCKISRIALTSFGFAGSVTCQQLL